MVLSEHRLHELFDETADLGGERGGDVDEVLLHGGHVAHVLRHLLEGVFRRAGKLEGLAFELIVALRKTTKEEEIRLRYGKWSFSVCEKNVHQQWP